MVSIEKIVHKFSKLDGYIKLLKIIAKTPREDFLRDKIIIGSAKYYLQVSIESCLDVANHIIASERLRPPRDYADTFVVLAEEKILPDRLCQSLRLMAKFRNRLVHLYGEVDDSYVYQFMMQDLGDIIEFKNNILKRLTILLLIMPEKDVE